MYNAIVTFIHMHIAYCSIAVFIMSQLVVKRRPVTQITPTEIGREGVIMKKVADIYEEQIEDDISHLVSIIEPTLVALLAIVIGAVLLTLMLPMTGILSSIL